MNYLKRNLISIAIGCIIGIPLSLYAVNHREPATIPVYYDPMIFQQYEFNVVPEAVQVPVYDLPVDVTTQQDIEEEMFYDSLELLAMCVEAEAGNQGLIGKKYVVDVVLNRVDDPDFPDNITDVILQCGSNGVHQFSVVGDGRIWNMTPTDETYQAIKEELEKRTNHEVLFFCSLGYSKYGTDWKKIGDHYFSTKK